MKSIYLFSFLLLFVCTKSTAQKEEFMVGGYVPSWKDGSAIDYSKLTHVYFAFIKANPDGSFLAFTLEEQTVFNTFKTRSVGKKRFISLGGGTDQTLPVMAATEAARDKFATACVQFCKDNELQGVDMDWEQIRDNTNATNYEALMKVLSEKLHAQQLLLVTTVAHGWGGEFYAARALKYADWIQLMAYDQVPYKDIAAWFPFLTPAINEYNLVVFNGPDLIKEKTSYAKRKGFKGVMVWELTQDVPSDQPKSLLKAIEEAVRE